MNQTITGNSTPISINNKNYVTDGSSSGISQMDLPKIIQVGYEQSILSLIGKINMFCFGENMTFLI